MRLFASLSLLATLALPVAAKADIVSLSDNFSTAPVGLGLEGAVDINFTTISNTNIDVLYGANYGYLCTSLSVTCIDLGGTGAGYTTLTPFPNGSPQGILQSSSEFAAGTYLLTYSLSPDQRGAGATTTVTFGSYTQTLSAGNISIDATLGTPGYLTFTDNVPGNEGNILNSVSVSQVSSTPEPSSLILLGSGLMTGAGMLFKRRNR